MTVNYDETLTERIERFANLALPIFRLNNWTYGSPATVPTADRIAETIAHCVTAVANGSPYARSGRIVALRDYEGDIVIALEFPRYDFE